MDVAATVPSRVLVIGAGVIGTVYAARLAISGLDVTVLARGDRLRRLEAEGAVVVRSPGGEPAQAWIRAVEHASDERFDLIILAVRREQVVAAVDALSGIESPIVLFFGNFAGMQDELAETAGRERTIFGFPGIAGRLDDRTVRYVQIRQQPTTLGGSAARSGAVLQVARALRRAGFDVSIVADMSSWLDAHAAFIVPITAAVRAAGGSADALSNNSRLLRLMVVATREAYDVLDRHQRLAAPVNLRLLYRLLPVGFGCWYWRRALRGEFGELAFAAHTRHAWPETSALAERVEKWFCEAAAPIAASSALRELLGLARQQSRA
jgi:2-dehydropantoate 2-reductase